MVIGLCIYVAAQGAAFGVLVYKVDKIDTANEQDRSENKERFRDHESDIINLRAEAAIHNTRITVLEQKNTK